MESGLGWSPAPAPGRAFSPLLPWAPQVALCFSPVGNKLRVRSRRFPAIVSCVAIDWFQEWPREALESVSLRFLRETAMVEVSTAGAARAVPGFEFFRGPQAVATPRHVVLVAAGCASSLRSVRAMPHTRRTVWQRTLCSAVLLSNTSPGRPPGEGSLVAPYCVKLN